MSSQVLPLYDTPKASLDATFYNWSHKHSGAYTTRHLAQLPLLEQEWQAIFEEELTNHPEWLTDRFPDGDWLLDYVPLFFKPLYPLDVRLAFLDPLQDTVTIQYDRNGQLRCHFSRSADHVSKHMTSDGWANDAWVLRDERLASYILPLPFRRLVLMKYRALIGSQSRVRTILAPLDENRHSISPLLQYKERLLGAFKEDLRPLSDWDEVSKYLNHSRFQGEFLHVLSLYNPDLNQEVSGTAIQPTRQGLSDYLKDQGIQSTDKPWVPGVL